MLATCDSNLDENPQVVAANFGSGDDRFVIGWHSVRDGSSNIQLLAVDGSGSMSNSLPGDVYKRQVYHRGGGLDRREE